MILITHLHGDHSFGLFGLIGTMGMNGRTTPLTIVGPKGIQDMLFATLAASSSKLMCD